jgi:ABC-type Mn2+/Zn2+ transport system permease subunit
MFELAFMRLALLASVAAGVALGIVGVYLVIRRVVFLGLVLASAATVGAAVGQILGWSPEAAGIVTTVAAALALGAIPALRRIPAESVMAWAYAAAAAATVLILAGAARADADTLRLLYGNVLAVNAGHAVGLALLAVVIVAVHGLFASRLLLVTFDSEGAQVAGIRARGWSIFLNLWIGVATAAAVHELGALLAFSLLTLAPTSSLLVARSVRSAFAVSASIGVAAVTLGLAGAWHLDLPPGPLSVALLAAFVVACAAIGKHRRLSKNAEVSGREGAGAPAAGARAGADS